MEKFNMEQEIQKLALHFSIVTLQLCHNPLINPFDLISKKKQTNVVIPSVLAPHHLLRVCAESRINRGSYFKICGLYVSGTWTQKSYH